MRPAGLVTMDKDVKRALLLWPAIASTAIIAATTLPLCWHQKESESFRNVATGSRAVSCLVRMTGAWLNEHRSVSPLAIPSLVHESIDRTCPDQPLIVMDKSLAESPMSKSIRTAARVGQRPERGVRGLALPTRLENAWSANTRNEEGVSLLAKADLVSSDKAIARTLLAPVLNPVAELAGFSGLASNHPPMMPSREDVSSVALPSRLSPGLEDPFAATGSVSQPSWMNQLDPVASWNAIAINQANARQPHCLNDLFDQPSQPLDPDTMIAGTLIPKSVSVLAKPAFEVAKVEAADARRAIESPAAGMRSSTMVGGPASWPQPKQLSRDLAIIAQSADLAKMVTSGKRESLTSVQLKIGEDVSSRGIINSLIAEGNASQASGQGVGSVRRHATSIVMGRWAGRVETTIADLQALPRIGDERSGKLIRQLASLSEAGLQLAERVPARDQQVRWLRAAHAASRRANVWGPIWQLARHGEASTTPSAHAAVDRTQSAVTHAANPADLDRQYLSLVRLDGTHPGNWSASSEPTIPALVENLRRELDETGDTMGWETFLLLDEVESAVRSSDADERALVAQRFLSRLEHHLLTPEHVEWLRRDNVVTLARAIQAWTVRPIDYTQLLGDLERGETDAIDLAAIKVGEAFQSLRFSDDVNAARVAKAIDVNYRNANVRTAISVRLIDRLLPAVPGKTQPLRTRVLGNEVRGTSHVDSQLGIGLTPSRDSWNLNVHTDGNVVTQGVTTQSGVTVQTSGTSQFHATTPLIIRPGKYTIGGTRVDVSGSQRLRGVQSRYDGWPLIGSLVRGIAESRFEQARPVASRVSETQIRTNVQQELQTELALKTKVGSQKLDEFVFGPLGRLNLEPKVVDMSTTQERLIARYRLAGDWQLAANTPRPRAWNDSWMSLQVHQSALNNTLEQLLPTGQSKTFEAFFQDTLELFGQDISQLPEDIPADAEIEFASTRPITVEMEDGKLTLTLRVVSLSQAGRANLRRFIVRASYRPVIDGLQARLVRDGHLSVSGPGMSMRQRFPIRALFNKVLSETRSIPLTLPRLVEHPATQDLAISQLELRDGWLALAISPNTSQRVAVGMRSSAASKAVAR